MLTLVLVAVMTLVYGTENRIESAAITAVVTINVIVGFSPVLPLAHGHIVPALISLYEYKEEGSINSLHSLLPPTALVPRNRETKHISARDVAAGDVVLIEPAISFLPISVLSMVSNLEIYEALLSDETFPVARVTDVPIGTLGADGEITPIGVGIVSNTPQLMSTKVGSVIDVATGMPTQVGVTPLVVSSKRRTSVDKESNSLPLPKSVFENLMLGTQVAPLRIKHASRYFAALAHLYGPAHVLLMLRFSHPSRPTERFANAPSEFAKGPVS